jgi:hypothetical protein
MPPGLPFCSNISNNGWRLRARMLGRCVPIMGPACQVCGTACVVLACQVAWWVPHGQSAYWVLHVMASRWDPHAREGWLVPHDHLRGTSMSGCPMGIAWQVGLMGPGCHGRLVGLACQGGLVGPSCHGRLA